MLVSLGDLSMDAIASRVAAGLAAQKNSAATIAGLMAAHGATAAEEAGSGDSPAVIKTISPDGEESDRTAWDKIVAQNGHTHLTKMSGEERGQRTQAYFDDLKRDAELSAQLRFMKHGRENLAEKERSYAKMSASEPVPPKELQGKELEAAFKLMDKLGIAKSTFGHDTSIFVNEGTRYILHRDGKLEAHDADIAPSQEEKTRWLESRARDIAFGKADPTALQAESDALKARISATKAELFSHLSSG